MTVVIALTMDRNPMGRPSPLDRLQDPIPGQG